VKAVKRLCAIAILTLPHHANAAGLAEMCTAVGGLFRDALLAESFKIAFDENLEWKGKFYESLPPTWREQLDKDIAEVKPKLIPATALILKQVPAWNEQGLDGMKRARQEIYTRLGPMNDAYLIRCIKMLQD